MYSEDSIISMSPLCVPLVEGAINKIVDRKLCSYYP